MEPRSREQLFEIYAQTKDQHIRNQLFEHYVYLAEILSKKFISRGADYDDLYQVACMSLIEALERFNISKGVQFQTFASTTIIGKLKNFLRDKSNVIRVPRKNAELISKVNKAKAILTQTLGHIPNISEIATYLQIDEDLILESLEAQYSCDTVSLDSLISPENDQDISSMIGEEDTSFILIEDRDFLERNLEKFNEIEKEVIYERFYNERTQRELAELLGVSQMYISRLERKILKRFQDEFRI